jgi:hypothetical protein
MNKQVDKKTTILQPNQGIYSILYGGRYGYITKIEGEQRPETIKSLLGDVCVSGGNANIFIRFSSGSETSVPESIVRGVQWEIYEILTEEEIKEIDQHYFEAVEDRKKAAIAKELKDKEETEYFLNKYSSYLIQKKDHAKGEFDVVKQNIRIELKREFPNIKFSVSSDHYGCVNIKWTDGETVESIKNITSKYEDHETDFTGDFRDYNPSNFNRIFGGCNFVFENRNISDKSNEILLEWAKERFANNDTYNCHDVHNLAHKLSYQYPIYDGFKIVKKDVEFAVYSPEKFWQIINVNKESVKNVVNKIKVNNNNLDKSNSLNVVKENSLNNNLSIKSKLPNDSKETILNIIDYSEKSFAITGDTYQIKDTLKELNGKFNRFLTCGAGWIFPKTKLNEVKEKLNIV